jgi:Na+-driven multidrug efflux pump
VHFANHVLRPVLPVLINEILWSLGITAYQVIYARLGTEQLAAVNISTTITDLAVVAFIGLGNATAILVGNMIGSGDEQHAQAYAGRSLLLSFLGSLLLGIALLTLSPFILSLYKVSPEVIIYARSVLLISASFLWLRMMNLIIFIGIFRAGGDTRFALLLDGFIIWLVGVPLTAYGAFVLHLPIYLVYLLTMSEEIAKWSLGLWRFFSHRWIHNLTETVVEIP